MADTSKIEMKSIIEHIEELSGVINENVFISSAREAFKEGISEYEISDEERAKLIAQYEANVSVGVITQIINLAKEFPELQARVALLGEQTISQTEQTKRISYETQEVKARTSKNYGFNITETDGVLSATDAKNGMIDKQIISEMWRHRDMKAGVIFKNKSIYATLENAKFEEARVHISLKANQDNLYLKKAEHKVAQLNAMAVDEDYIIAAEQIGEVQAMIEEIPTDPIEYDSNINDEFEEVETDDIELGVLNET
jgi:hypothetical protein